MDNLGDGANYAFFNNITYQPAIVPTLYTALAAGELATNPAVYGTYTNSFVLHKNQVIDIVVNNLNPGKHPFHLHGHHFQVIWRFEDEAGSFADSNVTAANFSRVSIKRDTVVVHPNGNIVSRFKSDNPALEAVIANLIKFIDGRARWPMRRLEEHTLGEPYTIRDALELYNLSTWGFVLIRCTYGSQEKWDKFLARVQGRAREMFEKAGLMDVYARMRWTIFEDAAVLDGADILETTRRFVEWVDRGPGGQELVGSVFGTTMAKTNTPRHNFFFHVDEESLESVVDDEKVAKALEEGRALFAGW
ncbi:hypothetical protein N0V88_000751 [Collariella sp. IMI 366227]|nr:hypothetical protein N0V88_000751 [Collariella sp. IMI 366227]